ncbi:hypothetical protein [Dickeya oryzae]|uniref:hypothetical protein n=1 Tax=Dickeya oryzae TaxID=1240404 RepID=UPI001AECA3E1|nr:hypothetical protein [Dickeya oryzae]MBP2849587.1 hypothetical protein [Dickeya oryzae]
MSGGISAIKGFDYQATVILSILFDHFERHTSAWARPEGIDDLDLSWMEGTTIHRQFVQIKKPTEDTVGNRNPTPWTVSTVVRELLPSAIRQLNGNHYRQLWVVGDAFEDAVIALIDAGEDAPAQVPSTYWRTIHALARQGAVSACTLTAEARKRLMLCKVPSSLSVDPSHAKAELVTSFRQCVNALGTDDAIVDDYTSRVSTLHHELPNVLTRIEIKATYGTEQEVVQRVAHATILAAGKRD